MKAFLVQNIISKPDEIYLTKGIRNKGSVNKTFIKYYENQPVIMFTKNNEIITIFKVENFEKIDREFRQGILIKNAVK